MALLSMWDNGAEVTKNATSIISSDSLILLFLVILLIILIIGLIWIIIKTVNLIDEKKRYYQNLNKKKIK